MFSCFMPIKHLWSRHGQSEARATRDTGRLLICAHGMKLRKGTTCTLMYHYFYYYRFHFIVFLQRYYLYFYYNYFGMNLCVSNELLHARLALLARATLLFASPTLLPSAFHLTSSQLNSMFSPACQMCEYMSINKIRKSHIQNPQSFNIFYISICQ